MFPTESSYALGVDPSHADAVAAVCELKRRPPSKPFPVVAGDLETLSALGVSLSRDHLGGFETGWPGPLSLVLPCSRPLPAAAGRRDLAVRIPGHGRLRELLARVSIALTATSANRSGEEPVLEVDGVDELVGDAEAVLIDEGRLPGGPPSTLVRLEGGRATVLRSGGVEDATLRRLAPGVELTHAFSAAAVEIPVEDIS